MQENFDPYHKWLAIPPEEQPPHRYRLLGLPLFEDDPDVIESAADQRMAHVRSFQTGQHSAVSQKLLNEIAAARVCLLDPSKKRQYDQQLREQGVTAGTAPTPAAPVPVAVPITDIAAPSIVTDTSVGAGRLRRKKFSWQLPTLAGVGAAALLLVVFLIVRNGGNGEAPEDAVDNDGLTQSSVPSPVPPKSSAEPSTVQSAVEPDPSDAGESPVTHPVVEDGAPQGVEDKPPPETSPPRLPQPASAAVNSTKQPPKELIAEATAQEKQAVPSASAQQDALKLVKEVYGDEYAKAQTDKQKQVLAKKLLSKATESQDTTNRYVLLRIARDVATNGGDGQTAFQAIDEMDRVFQVDAVKMKASVLASLSKKVRSRSHRKSIAEQALPLVDQAITRDDFDLAGNLIDMALVEARKAREGELVKKIATRRKELEDITKAYEEVKVAARTLEDNPTDPAANLVVGKYHCFIKGDWDKGLPMLALGSDPVLKALAMQELAKPSTPEAQVAVGDSLWELGSEPKAKERAAYWYKKAIPGLTGLVKEKVKKRLVESATGKGRKEEKPRVMVLFKNGRPKVPVEAKRPWKPGNGFAEGQGYIKGHGPGRTSGFSNGLRFSTELGEEDFVLIITMSLEVTGTSTSSRIALYGKNQGTLGLDAFRPPTLVFEGKLFGKKGLVKCGRAAPYIKKGVPFRLQIQRQEMVLVWSIDGHEIARVPLSEKKIGQFAVVPFRGRIRLYEVVLKK